MNNNINSTVCCLDLITEDLQSNDINMDVLINKMSKYTLKDLTFARDCIDLMIIYYNR